MFCGISLGTCSHPALLHVLPFAGIPLWVVGACLHVRPPERVLWVEGPVRCLRGWLVQQSLPEGECEYRNAQFECWALTQRVAHELRSDAHNAVCAACDVCAKVEAAEEAVTAHEL